MVDDNEREQRIRQELLERYADDYGVDEPVVTLDLLIEQYGLDRVEFETEVARALG